MSPAKTICAMHDLSSVGRSALTAIIPTLSAMGVQTIPAPTAVLSAHTAFPHPVITDLTDYLRRCTDYWQEMHIRFDCIYTGYMSSPGQEQIAQKLMQNAPNAFRLVDPVLGDDGEMYQGLPETMIPAMRSLCHSADLITPNLTEAALLLGAPLDTPPETLADSLSAVGAKKAVLTGVPFGGDRIGIFSRDYAAAASSAHHTPRAEGMLHGTGDVFASALIGLLLGGMPFPAAAAAAADFTADCIERTLCAPDRRWYGIRFEPELPQLAKRLSAVCQPSVD